MLNVGSPRFIWSFLIWIKAKEFFEKVKRGLKKTKTKKKDGEEKTVK